MNVTFTLEKQTAVQFLNFLGTLPSNTGIFPILQDFVAQFNQQTANEVQPAEVQSEVVTDAVTQ